jgi:hypothetical protein
LGLRKAVRGAVRPGDFDLLRKPLAGLLRNMGVAGSAPARFNSGDIDKFSRFEGARVFGDFVVVKGKLSAALEPGIEGKSGNGPMVAMRIDWPLREYDPVFPPSRCG